jgi:hypothetical protein
MYFSAARSKPGALLFMPLNFLDFRQTIRLKWHVLVVNDAAPKARQVAKCSKKIDPDTKGSPKKNI